MNKILLLRPNHTNDKKDHYISFPSGIAYIAAILKQNGYDVKVIDLTLLDVVYDELKHRILDYAPDIIGLSALSHGYPHTKRLSLFLKSFLSIKIILGGHLATYDYKIVLKHTEVDYCVLGEGERTIIDLLENLDCPERVKGIAYKENTGKIRVTEPRELIADLDSLPYPAYELFDMKTYTKMSNVYMSEKNLPTKGRVHKKIALETGRGCPFSCRYCSKIYSNIRRRSVDHTIGEITFLRDNYDIDIFRFQDELFFFSMKYVKEFCDKIFVLGVGWSGNARIDTVTPEMIRYIMTHNCISVSFGIESGSAIILRNMNKKITPEQIENTMKLCLQEGLPVSINLILGYPGENSQSVQETVDLLKRVGYPGVKFHYITPYPGSPLYSECLDQGLIEDEEEYLMSLGDGSGPYRFRFNFTDFTDQELADLLPETAKKVMRNYFIFLLKNPSKLFKYIRHKDIMNPFWYLYNKKFRPTNYDKAAKLNKKAI